MQDDCRIFGNGKSSKTTNKNQHRKFPSGLGYPKPEGKTKENLTHFFGYYPSQGSSAAHTFHAKRRTFPECSAELHFALLTLTRKIPLSCAEDKGILP